MPVVVRPGHIRFGPPGKCLMPSLLSLDILLPSIIVSPTTLRFFPHDGHVDSLWSVPYVNFSVLMLNWDPFKKKKKILNWDMQFF